MKSYDLTLAAEEDLRGIWRYTYEAWGPVQAEKYFDQIVACCEAVGEGRARSKSFTSYPTKFASTVANITTSSGSQATGRS